LLRSRLAELPKTMAAELSNDNTEVLSEGSEGIGRVFALPLQASVFTGTLAPAVLGKRACASAQLHLRVR
jgi:hypothetical protein